MKVIKLSSLIIIILFFISICNGQILNYKEDYEHIALQDNDKERGLMDYFLNTRGKIKLNEHIHFIPLDRWLKTIDYFDSVKKHTSYVDMVPFDKTKITKDLFFYLHQSKLIDNGKIKRREFLLQLEQKYVRETIYFHKDLYRLDTNRRYDNQLWSWEDVHKSDYATYRAKAREKFLETANVLWWWGKLISQKKDRRFYIENYSQLKTNNNSFEKRVLNYYLSPEYERNLHFQAIEPKKQLDSILLNLDYSFYTVDVGTGPTIFFPVLSNGLGNDMPTLITIENISNYVPHSSRIKYEDIEKYIKYRQGNTLGRYNQSIFLIAIPNKEILGNIKENKPDISGMKFCIDCLPKLFLSRDMIDYEYQKKFLLAYLKKEIQNEENAIKLFIYLQLLPVQILQPLTISPDITLSQKGNSYEWECSAGFTEYDYNSYKIKGTLKGTEIKGKLIFPKEMEVELEALKKLGFTLKEKGKRFDL